MPNSCSMTISDEAGTRLFASAPQSPARKRVRGKPRNRTGCITCRIRRIKCDEQKPSCIRCTSTGRRCDGYRHSQNITHQSSITKLDHPRLIPNRSPLYSTIPRTLSDSPFPWTEAEQRGVEHFRHRTTSMFSGYFESEFWASVVLRLVRFEPSVLHAVLAVSTLHESFELAGTYDLNHQPNQQLRRTALLQYGEAIRETRQLIASNTLHTSDVALVSCLLFVYLEIMQDNHYAALDHLGKGLKILATKPKFEFDQALGQLFSRILLQSVFLGAPHFNPRLLPKTLSPPCLLFARIEDARNSLEALFGSAYPFLSLGLQNDMPKEMTLDPVEQYQKLSRDLAAWQNTFQDFIKTCKRHFTVREETGIELLQLHCTCLNIMMIMALRSLNADAIVVPEFVKVLSIVKRLVHISETHLEPYSFQTGVIGPIFYTLSQCPITEIRKEALALLQGPNIPYREGIWGVVMTRRLADRVVMIGGEELRASPVREGIGSENKGTFLKGKDMRGSRFPAWALEKVKWGQQEGLKVCEGTEDCNRKAWKLVISAKRSDIRTEGEGEEIVTW